MKESLKNLSATQKIQYIWDYYKFRITVTFIIICLLISCIVRWSNQVETNVYCIVLNDPDNKALREHIMSTYSDYINDDSVTASVDIGYMFSKDEEDGIIWPDNSASIKHVQLQTTGEADVAIGDYNSLLWAKHADFLTPVEDILPDDLYEQLEPYFVYVVFEDDTNEKGDGIVYALDISDTEIYKGHSLNYEDALVYFPNVSKDPDAAVRFIKYLYGIEYKNE